jgi:CPA2 family monovalent cation:H+ antiporter-2
MAGVALLKHLHLPPLLGYILIGAGFAPFLPAPEQHNPTARLAEFGVVFLMFSIGLEFSLAKLRTMRLEVFGLGGLQVIASILLVTAFGLLLGLSWESGIAMGAVLAMSSTAIVSRMLADRNELDSPHGRQIFGVLLFQDLAVAPLAIFIPALAASQDMAAALGLASLKAAIALGLILTLGQRLMRPWFHLVARAKSAELFMLNVLFITLGLAWVTDSAGLSLALGAFLAGVLISETEYRYQVESDIRPFRDVLMGLFFVTIGLLLDFAVVAELWREVLAMLVLLLLGKTALVLLLAGLFNQGWATALRTGLALGQAGEFGFVLLGVAVGHGLLDHGQQQSLLGAMVLSMLAAPLLIQASDRLARRLEGGDWNRRAVGIHEISAKSFGISQHVILCGYGRSGQSLARLLQAEQVPYIALDHDPRRVSAAAAAGEPVVFGDSTRSEVLLAAGVRRARAVVVTFAHTPAALKTLGVVRGIKQEVPVIVRTLDESDLGRLKDAGAAEVVPEVMEGALMLGSQTLLMAGLPLARVLRRIRATREARYSALRGYFRGLTDDQDEDNDERLASIRIDKRLPVLGKSLAELDLESMGVMVVALRRRGAPSAEPTPGLRLAAEDILILRGGAEELAAAELRLAGD